MKTDEKVNQDIGKNIKKLREEKGINQKTFAKMIGYTCNSTLNRIEKGKAGVSPRMLAIISKKLKVNIADITEKNNKSIIDSANKEIKDSLLLDELQKIIALLNIQNKITREIKKAFEKIKEKQINVI